VGRVAAGRRRSFDAGEGSTTSVGTTGE